MPNFEGNVEYAPCELWAALATGKYGQVRTGFASTLSLWLQRHTDIAALGAEAPLKQSTATHIRVKVKPNSRISSLEPAEGGAWLARLRSAPVGGKANQELIALLAEHFQCRKSAVSIKSGAAGRMKLVRIELE